MALNADLTCGQLFQN